MNPICGLETIGLCIPLLAIVCALSTRGAALVTRVTRDTGQRVSAVVCECICRGWNGMDCTPCLRCVKMSVQSLNVSVRRQKVGIERTYRLEISSRALGVGCSCCNLSLEVGVVKASQKTGVRVVEFLASEIRIYPRQKEPDHRLPPQTTTSLSSSLQYETGQDLPYHAAISMLTLCQLVQIRQRPGQLTRALV